MTVPRLFINDMEPKPPVAGTVQVVVLDQRCLKSITIIYHRAEYDCIAATYAQTDIKKVKLLKSLKVHTNPHLRNPRIASFSASPSPSAQSHSQRQHHRRKKS
jgi:hypothetical protein